MTNDHSDAADELIVRAAKGYNEPGAVPREEIWNRIVEARRLPALAQPIVRQRTRYWLWPSVGVAAAGLIAVGVGIGRRVERSHQPGLQVLPFVAQNASHDTGAKHAPAPNARDVAVHPQPADAAARDARMAAARSLALGDESGSGAIAFRLAVVDHVVGSEAMITAFRASAQRGEVDAQLAKWSRDLLGETRLLESAAPPDDLTLKRLLEDLDLVLAQIVQYSNRGSHSPEDLDLIERSIRRRAVMSNLRNISAGRLPSGA